MRVLDVSVEIEGRQREIGTISGDSPYSAVFRYSRDYLESPFARSISLSLPLQEAAFGPEETRSFFEGLLPEGFLKQTVAENNRTDSSDYLSLLELLGSECLGAVLIRGADYDPPEPVYKELDPYMMFRIASEGATTSADLVVEAHLSLTGASGKIGAYLGPGGKWYLPVGSAPSTHILKQSHIRYDHIVQNEQLTQKTAAHLGLSVPDSRIIGSSDDPDGGQSDPNEVILFAARRYDRTMDGSVKQISGMPCPLRLHQEDFGQAMGIAAADKYEREGGQYMRRMFDILRRWSASPIEDQMKLWDTIVFHWLIGNTDGHIKNFSLIYDRKLSSVRLAPAYDMLSTVVYDSHSSNMAFAIGGETNWYRINRHSFEIAADDAGLNRGIFMKRFDDLQERFPMALDSAAGELAEDGHGDAAGLADRIRAASTRRAEE